MLVPPVNKTIPLKNLFSTTIQNHTLTLQDCETSSKNHFCVFEPAHIFATGKFVGDTNKHGIYQINLPQNKQTILHLTHMKNDLVQNRKFGLATFRSFVITDVQNYDPL